MLILSSLFFGINVGIKVFFIIFSFIVITSEKYMSPMQSFNLGSTKKLTNSLQYLKKR